MPPPGGTQESNTTATRRSSSRMGTSTQEIITTKNEVMNVVSARKYLERTAMAISGKPYATDKLADILFHITQLGSISLPAQTAIRAVAFNLEESAAIEIASTVAKHVITAIAPHIAKMHETSESIATSSNLLKDTQTKINDITLNANNTNADAIINSATIDSRLDKMHQAVTSLTTQVKESSQQGGYKAALLSGLNGDNNINSQDVRRIARDAIKACQILINLPLDGPLAPGKILHAQLVDKIKTVLKTLQKESTPELELRAVTQYRNGGTVLEMLTPEAATHLKKEDIRKNFLDALDPKATFKERAYPVVIQFVPLNFNPSDITQIEELEKENGWEKGALTSARWIKPPGKCANTQKVAHIIATFNNPNIANLGIRDGIMLNQARLQIKKNRREPIRCAKCQGYGHIAKECLNHKDTCANCAEEHRTSECTNGKNQPRCVPCRLEDHPSWSRSCPEFECRCIDLDHRYPENTMPYYPTDEDWTQAQAPAKAKPFIRTPPTSQQEPEPPHHAQGTLDRHLAPKGRGAARPIRGQRGYRPPSTRLSNTYQDSTPPWNTPDAPSTPFF